MEFNLKAAGKANQSFANREALAYFDQANDYAREVIRVAGKMGEKSVLAGGHFILGEVEALTGRLDEAKQKVNRALNISRAAGDLIYQSLSLGLLGHFKNWTGEYTGAIDLLSKG